jgi:predicted ATP-dependent endonuclease of OLD family
MTRIQSQNGTAPLSEEPNQQELMEGQAELAPQMNLILAIEEPELFQHPSRQRHFSSILRELATGSIPGVAEQTQVIYCTHSPLFVDIDQFENIRLIRKIQGTQQDTPQQTSVKKASIDQTIDRIKLSVMLTPAINEGFFAKMVILVEGTGDKAYLEMVARYCIKKPLETYGIVVISVDGKENLQKPLIVFPAFGIQVYPVWDNDKDKQGQSAEAKTIQSNRKILAACNCTEEDWPQGVHDAYAIFEPTLEHILEQEITSILAAGETWSSFMQTVKDTIQDDNLKRHAVVSQVVKQGYDKGCKFPLASQILNKVIECAGIL